MNNKKRHIIPFSIILSALAIGFYAGRASRYWDVRNAEDTVKCLGWGNDQLRMEIDNLNHDIKTLQDSIMTLKHK